MIPKTPEQRDRMNFLIRARKERLIAEGCCIDCKEPKQDSFRRCTKCRIKAAERERERHRQRRCSTAQKRPVECAHPPIKPPDPLHVRNAKNLREELMYDEGLEPKLRYALIGVIDQWRARHSPRKQAA